MKSASQPFFEHRVMTQRTTVKETLAVTGTGHLANRPLPPTCKQYMIPYGEMPNWGKTARFLIDKKQKLRLGVSKN